MKIQKEKTMSNFLNKNYQTLESYVPGEQPTDMKYIKLIVIAIIEVIVELYTSRNNNNHKDSS